MLKGNRVNGGSGLGRGEVQGPEAVLGCLAAGKEWGALGDVWRATVVLVKVAEP